MPPLTDPAEIRTILNTDRPWAVYALGDLAPGFFEHASWFRAPDGAQALALLYRAFVPPVFFALGEAEAVHFLLPEIGREPEFYLSVRPDVPSTRDWQPGPSAPPEKSAKILRIGH